MKLLTLIILSASMVGTAIANMEFAPQDFALKNKTAVFVDFKTIDAQIDYDLANQKTTATSKVILEVINDGYPILDLKTQAITVEINGVQSNLLKINDPTNTTSYQLLNQYLLPGTHELIITNEITENVKYSGSSVQSAFWMSDLTDRKYIEQYLPTNIEYDQYSLNLDISISGSKVVEDHVVYTNGSIVSNTTNNFSIRFPEYFTSSSFYFHLSKKDEFKESKFIFKSINGNDIPVVIYTKSLFTLNTAKKRTIDVLNELEAKLGAWSHPSFTAYIAGRGGMEHSGATITSMRALGHEITHSYFARGVMPADGNSGWLDEAIASWRDDGYKSTQKPNFNSTTMSGHSQYRRTTDRKAYTQGANFMAYLNHKLTKQGGLISFLAKVHANYVHKSITTSIFKKELELYSGIDFTKDFNRYIFGSAKNVEQVISTKLLQDENPYHPKLTARELKDLL